MVVEAHERTRSGRIPAEVEMLHVGVREIGRRQRLRQEQARSCDARRIGKNRELHVRSHATLFVDFLGALATSCCGRQSAPQSELLPAQQFSVR